MNKGKKQKEFYKQYESLPPSILAMIWVDIEELLEARDKELIRQINEIDEFGETYCERDEALFEAVKQEIIELIKQ